VDKISNASQLAQYLRDMGQENASFQSNTPFPITDLYSTGYSVKEMLLPK
jgi:hypothetical protein